MSYQMRAHQACVINTSPVLPGSPQAQQPGLPEDPRWALCSVLCALAYANDSLALATHLTYFQSGSPFASVNASIASMNDSFPLAMQLTCIHQNTGVTRVTPVLTSLESITIPQ